MLIGAFQVPVTPSLEVVGNAVSCAPEQIGAACVNVVIVWVPQVIGEKFIQTAFVLYAARLLAGTVKLQEAWATP